MKRRAFPAVAAALAAGMSGSFGQPRAFPIGTALRYGKPILVASPDELASFHAKVAANADRIEQERIAKGKARKERRAAKRQGRAK